MRKWVVAHVVLCFGSAFGLDIDNGGAGDGMSDLWQERYGIGVAESLADGDGDGYSNALESKFRSDPGDPNSPGDIGEFKIMGADHDLDMQTVQAVRYLIRYTNDLADAGSWQTSPTIFDGDGGILTVDLDLHIPVIGERLFVEFVPVTPNDADSDQLDQWEEEVVLLTSDQKSDTDDDRVSDLLEYQNALNPLSAVSNDGDTLPDDWETFYFSDLDETEEGDDDNDLIANEFEFLAGLDPTQDNLNSGGNVSVAQYNASGQLIQFDPPASAPVSYIYDEEGNITAVSQ